MKRISNFKKPDNHHIELTFNDEIKKVINFSPFIKDDKLSKSLADPSYFKKVQLYKMEEEYIGQMNSIFVQIYFININNN